MPMLALNPNSNPALPHTKHWKICVSYFLLLPPISTSCSLGRSEARCFEWRPVRKALFIYCSTGKLVIFSMLIQIYCCLELKLFKATDLAHTPICTDSFLYSSRLSPRSLCSPFSLSAAHFLSFLSLYQGHL